MTDTQKLIERLREYIEELEAQCRTLRRHHVEALNCIESLQLRMVGANNALIDSLAAREKAEDEVARLREALKKAKNTGDTNCPFCLASGSVIRSALGQT